MPNANSPTSTYRHRALPLPADRRLSLRSAQNNGVDSFICGSLFDFGFAGDTNYAQTVHHRLFESTNTQGEIRRNDIVSLNICRAREHGIPGYNAYRQLCGLKRAARFEDFTDSMTMENAEKLRTIYQ